MVCHVLLKFMLGLECKCLSMSVPGMHKALSSNSTTGKKESRRERREGGRKVGFIGESQLPM